MSPEQAAEKWENDWLMMGSAARRATLAALIREREQAVYAECAALADKYKAEMPEHLQRAGMGDGTETLAAVIRHRAFVAIEAARIAAGGEK